MSRAGLWPLHGATKKLDQASQKWHACAGKTGQQHEVHEHVLACREGAEASSHWAWQRRPRYSMPDKTEDVVLAHGSASLLYGWEYLGACPRAALTPAAQAGQLCLATAIHMRMGALALGGCSIRCRSPADAVWRC